MLFFENGSLRKACKFFANKWEFEQMGICPKTSLQVFREQMGFRTNGNLKSENTHSDTKWEVFCSFKSCCSFQFWLDYSSCIKNSQCVLSIENNIFSRMANFVSEKCAKVFVALCVLPASIRRVVFTCFHCFLPQHKFNINVII